MNKNFLLGRLTRDPETRYSGETIITKFSIAVPRKFKKDEADFISCVAFNKRAESISKYFCKGMKILIEGHLQTGSYTNKDGQKVYTTDVVVDEWEFGESKHETPDNPVDGDGFVPTDDIAELPF